MLKFEFYQDQKRLGNLLSLLLLVIAIFGIVYTGIQPDLSRDLGRRLISAPPQIEHLSFGFSETMADGFWLRSIQDIDLCDTPLGHQKCRGKSWLYSLLDAATNLSPKFEMVYIAGGLCLSVLVNDVEGASLLFEKGVKNLPNNWDLAKYAAEHAAMEEKNYPKAAQYLLISARAGGPQWFYSLAQNLYLKSGQRALGEMTLQELKKNPEANAKLIERLEKRLALFDKEGYTPETANPALTESKKEK